MSFETRLITRLKIGRDRWNSCADGFPDAWLWHRWEAIEAYATWSGTVDISFAILDPQENRPIALVPLRDVAGRKPFHSLLRHLESTGGPAFDPNLSARQRRNAEAAVKSSLIALATQQNAHRIDLSVAPLAPTQAEAPAGSINPLVMFGCREASTQSWILDLSGRSEDELWRNLEQRVRKSVNRAKREGVTIRAATHDDKADFICLHMDNARRTGIPPKPLSYFDKIFDDFLNPGMASGFCALAPDGNTIAIHVFAEYKDGALYWVVASDDEALSNGTNDLVQWHAIKSFAARGLARYECGEAFPGLSEGKLRRISDFKKGFGGVITPYYRGTMTTRPIVAAILDLLRAIRSTQSTGDA
ncbi:MAG: GNAT family N-acetyltransferase [Alphaproteobacteria bacterium]|nr:GNAT family N-acetyltransferase [Alphaproteobacteria bacterium]